MGPSTVPWPSRGPPTHKLPSRSRRLLPPIRKQEIAPSHQEAGYCSQPGSVILWVTLWLAAVGCFAMGVWEAGGRVYKSPLAPTIPSLKSPQKKPLSSLLKIVTKMFDVWVFCFLCSKSSRRCLMSGFPALSAQNLSTLRQL
jgi:hypothetical protein